MQHHANNARTVLCALVLDVYTVPILNPILFVPKLNQSEIVVMTTGRPHSSALPVVDYLDQVCSASQKMHRWLKNEQGGGSYAWTEQKCSVNYSRCFVV